jgi:hypothetical protein
VAGAAADAGGCAGAVCWAMALVNATRALPAANAAMRGMECTVDPPKWLWSRLKREG